MDNSLSKDKKIYNRLVYNVLSNYAGKILALGVGFLLTPFILHRLGDGRYGLFVLVSSLVAYGSLLDLGFAGAIVKYIAEYRAKADPEGINRLLATSLCFYALLGIIALVLTVMLAPVIPAIFKVPLGDSGLASRLFLWMGGGVSLAIPCAVSIAVLRGLQRFDLANLIGVGSTLLSSAATAAILLLGGGVIEMAAAAIPIMLFMQIPAILIIHRTAPEIQLSRGKVDFHLFRKIVPFSSSLFILNLSGQVQTKTDEIVIGAFLPVSAVAPYAVSRRLSEMPQILTDQFMKVLMPLASELNAAKDRERLRFIYLVGTRITLAVLLPLACTLIFLARPILSVWIGENYARYAPLIVIISLATLIDTSQWPAGNILQGMARHQPLVIFTMSSAIVNLALSIFLVSRLGLIGVALGTLIPTAVECIGFVFPYSIRVIGVHPKEVLKEVILPVFLPAVPMASLLLWLSKVVKLDSIFMIGLVSLLSLGIYILGYLWLSTGRIEHRLLGDLWLGTKRFARIGLKYLF